ncbi:hypothetical protein KPL39_02035 [Clostridium gasigenes]|uniref:hypothetical protein n=1 Tax=Clostridium gasigenes TaxID=94869 RepID=UPI001C0E5F81|nr:hypothetical protein [Clostridium gasigenes]MBU3135040.1 hypothetical protein [Clostridium gasigenes]
MAYNYGTAHLTGQQQAIIREQERKSKLLEENKDYYTVSNNNEKKACAEKKIKELEICRSEYLKYLEKYYTQFNSVSILMGEFLTNDDNSLRENIKEDFRKLKDNIKIEKEKVNSNNWHGGRLGYDLYKPAINDSYSKISIYSYTRMPTKEILEKINESAMIIKSYLEKLESIDIKELL